MTTSVESFPPSRSLRQLASAFESCLIAPKSRFSETLPATLVGGTEARSIKE
jgi:hypothetical protein